MSYWAHPLLHNSYRLPVCPNQYPKDPTYGFVEPGGTVFRVLGLRHRTSFDATVLGPAVGQTPCLLDFEGWLGIDDADVRGPGAVARGVVVF